MKVRALKKKRRLTQEQEETRLRGLRILARMIVRAHLDSPAVSADGGGHGPEGPARDLPGKDGEHVR